MTTITIKSTKKISRTSFDDLEDLQLFLIEEQQKNKLNNYHKKVLDERLLEANEQPENYISLNDLKSNLKRK